MLPKSTSRALILLFTLQGCVNHEIPTGPNCGETPLDTPTAVVIDASSCTAADGQITVTATGGVPPYTYQWNFGSPQESPVFTGRTAGLYPIIVKDSRGCSIEFDVTVNTTGSTLLATAEIVADTECFPPHDGSITVLASGGTPPYQVKFGTGAFGTDTVFTSLEAGNYTVVVKDDAGCTVTIGDAVPRGDTGTSFSAEVNPIIAQHCAVAGCHTGGGLPSFTTYAGVASQANSIKSRTASGSMPPAGKPDLTPQQIKIIGCWVDDGAKNN